MLVQLSSVSNAATLLPIVILRITSPNALQSPVQTNMKMWMICKFNVFSYAV